MVKIKTKKKNQETPVVRESIDKKELESAVKTVWSKV